MHEFEIGQITLSNFIYTNTGYWPIDSIVRKDGNVLINNIPADEILFFDISWIGPKEFALYGFQNVGSHWEKDRILLRYFPFDHWHVQKDAKDFGERFYTARELEKIAKEKFNIELKINHGL
jgi:hypothetical protein